MDTSISDSVHVYANAAKANPNISLTDCIDLMQSEVALTNWCEGIAFNRQQAQETLLHYYPHLQATVP